MRMALDELKSHGINTLMVKGGYNNNKDYSSYPDKLPGPVKQLASWAKQKDMMYFQALNFAHFTAKSIVTDSNVVYKDGTSGTHVSPWSRAYWEHLTELVKNLAALPVNYPDQYRIDGIMFDFELYHNREIFFTKSWGFEDTTFNNYISVNGLMNHSPPTNPDQRAQRYSWLGG